MLLTFVAERAKTGKDQAIREQTNKKMVKTHNIKLSNNQTSMGNTGSITQLNFILLNFRDQKNILLLNHENLNTGYTYMKRHLHNDFNITGYSIKQWRGVNCTWSNFTYLSPLDPFP